MATPAEPQSRNRKLSGWAAKTLTGVSVATALFHVYALGIESPGVLNLRAVHLAVGLVLIPLLFAGWQSARNRVHWSDLVLAAAGLACTIYVLVEGPNLIWRYGVQPTPLDLFFGGLLILLILELTRRTVGWPLVIVILALIVYALYGDHFPGVLQTRAFSPRRMISFLFSMDGIYGIPIGASSTFIYLFVLFGALLRASRAGDFYMDLAYSLAGRTRGGPAKIAVVSSALFGTISGTGIANVVTTGTLTIPLMKRTGFSAQFAAAVEAVASTGGQIMPPIMGAGAFLMAEIIRVPYSEIMVAAAIPAVLYFLAVFLIVDLEASKSGLRGLKPDELPQVGAVLRRWGHLIIPVLVLLYVLLAERATPIRAALFAMAATLIVSWFRPEGRLDLRNLVSAMVDGTKGSLEVIASCAAAGLIVGLFSLTGLGLRLSGLVVALAEGHLLIALLLTMVVTIILSMGLPTTAAYIVSASVIAPALTELGLTPLQAHLFIFYFACLSAITPPVALVAYPAASIAGANPVRVGVSAFQMSLASFLVPYTFAYSPSLLLKGSAGGIVLETVTAILGVWALAAAVTGWCMGTNLSLLKRLLLTVGAANLIFPGASGDLVGIVIIALTLGGQWWAQRRAQAQSAALPRGTGS